MGFRLSGAVFNGSPAATVRIHRLISCLLSFEYRHDAFECTGSSKSSILKLCRDWHERWMPYHGISATLLAAFALFVRTERIDGLQLFESGVSTSTAAIEQALSLLDRCRRRTAEGRRLCKWRRNVPH